MILIYENGQVYYIEASQIYEPFPERKANQGSAHDTD